MKITSEAPFLGFTAYLNHHKGMNRMQVCLVPIGYGKRRTLTYAKYLLSVSLGRVIGPDEEVDHIDDDKTNDDIGNLQILSRPENTEKHLSTLSRATSIEKCPQCLEQFEIETRHVKSRMKNNARLFCSRACSNKFYWAMRK